MKIPNLKTWILVSLALIFGLMAGWVDFKSGKALPAALILFVGNGILGYLWPGRTWLGALISGSAILLFYFIFGILLDFEPKAWPLPNVFATLLAIIPAFIGAYWGASVNRIFDSVNKT